ncbi:MAG TPA: Lrp/AsnC family transcriptional regulator [Kiloniellales bacterium]|nr:Lrp/AsnC family transcriptional regulator [Kiloniellales bacterium]
MDSRLDAIDLLILRELQQDGRLSIVDLAQRVGLSPSPCLRRVRHLEERRVIAGYRALLDPQAIGLGLQAFVSFRVESHDRAQLERLRATIAGMPEVLASYSVSGDVDAMLHVAVPDLAAFERFIGEKLLTLPVRDLRSSFVIAVRKPPGPLPLDHLEAAAAGGAQEP